MENVTLSAKPSIAFWMIIFMFDICIFHLPLPLSLLMAWIGADDAQTTATSDVSAMHTDLFYRSFYFHVRGS